MTDRSDAPRYSQRVAIDNTDAPRGGAKRSLGLRIRWLRARLARLNPTTRGLLWTMCASLLFVFLNGVMRGIAMDLHPMQAQFLRYLGGFLVLLPIVLRHGLAAYRPTNIRGQFLRGLVHTAGLCVWFLALPHLALADTTAIGFTTPIFIMLGAWLFFRETMRWERWLAASIGFAGVLIVVAPKLQMGSWYSLLMLASAPMFAASFLITKALTRYETPGVIVLWQAITVTLLSLPLAIPFWTSPTAWQWCLSLVCGLLGSAGHYCLTRAYAIADISATQSVKFLELVWAAAVGWLLFSDVPSQWTFIGGLVISLSTLWIARRESRRR